MAEITKIKNIEMRNAKIEDIEINDESYHHANNTNDRTSMMMYSTIGQILTEASIVTAIAANLATIPTIFSQDICKSIV